VRKEGLERKGLRINLYKTNLTVGGERQYIEKCNEVDWSCVVCDNSVGCNSIQCSADVTEAGAQEMQ